MTARRKLLNSICAKMSEMSNEALAALDAFARTLISAETPAERDK